MDDIIFQCNNQNSIYVLNSNYKSYEGFSRLNLIESIGAQLNPDDNAHRKDTINCCHALTTKLASRSCSTVSRTLQHKLRSLGNFSDSITEKIGPPMVFPSATSITSSEAVTSSSTCLPTATALHKLFNCSNIGSVPGNCVSIPASGHSSTENIRCSRDKKSLASIRDDISSNVARSEMSGNCRYNKKKCGNVKSSLIAKKTKFWQVLEEEKRMSHDDNSNYTDPQNSANSKVTSSFTGSSKFQRNSSVKESSAAPNANTSPTSTLTASAATYGPLNNSNSNNNNNNIKHYSGDKLESNATKSNGSSQRQQNKLNNWSGSGDSNSQHKHPQHHQQPQQEQQQQQQQQQKQQLLEHHFQQQKMGNYELYKEATELLGLPCTLCDNCRCLDCQSRYFDCDDSDNCSELSYVDEFDDDVSTMSNAIELVMYANYYGETMPPLTTHGNAEQVQRRLCSCTDVNRTQSIVSDTSDSEEEPVMCNFSTNSNRNEAAQGGTIEWTDQSTANKPIDLMSPSENKWDVCSATIDTANIIKFESPLKSQSQQNHELENCANFNDLKLTDISPEMNTYARNALPE